MDREGVRGLLGSRYGHLVVGLVRRPVPAAVLLFAVYLGLSLLCSPEGFLGTDTGGKVATLRVMAERGDLDPDVGYWAAEWDQQARFHGLFFTSVVGDRYLNVTTLPMLLAAAPLFDLWGYRGALLLPMAGAVGTAFAARALARRLGGGDGWGAFWLAGLATPVAVYALDFWEHAPGLALMAWAAVLALDAAAGGPDGGPRPRWWSGLACGALLGAAASMRTEVFVYALTTVGVASVAMLGADLRRVGRVIAFGSSAVVGFAFAFAANLALEVAVVGEQLRGARATGAAAGGLSELGMRVEEGLVTTLSPFPTTSAEGWIVGACLLVGLVLLVRRSSSPPGEPAPLRVGSVAVVAGVVVVVVYAWRALGGFGFVPGLVAATPFAAAGLVLGWDDRRARLVALMGLVPVPLVVAFQFTGGAAPQWAGRYLLCSGLLLAVVGFTATRSRTARPVRDGLVVLSALVTAFGVGWLAVRSHQIADAADRLQARPEEVLVSPNGFVPREFGATYPDKRWLASRPEEVDLAVDVVWRSGSATFALVDLDTEADPPDFPGWVRSSSELEPFLSGGYLRVTSYVRAAPGDPPEPADDGSNTD